VSYCQITAADLIDWKRGTVRQHCPAMVGACGHEKPCGAVLYQPERIPDPTGQGRTLYRARCASTKRYHTVDFVVVDETVVTTA
jgi:hypothetical protein